MPTAVLPAGPKWPKRRSDAVRSLRSCLVGFRRIDDGAGYACGERLSCRIRSAAFSATISTGVLVLPEGILGDTEGSTTRKAATPCTRSRASTTALRASEPIEQVQLAWNTLPARRR